MTTLRPSISIDPPPGRVVERVTEWAPDLALGLEVAESDWPIVYMRWVSRLSPDGAGTRVEQQLDYQLRCGPVGWLLDAVVMRRKLDATIGEVFVGLERHAEGAAPG